MRLLLLPCDTRPPTLDLPHQLAQMAGVALCSPPLPLLNRLNEPADIAGLHDWLLEQARDADALIVSLETLTLGGLIPARRVTDPLSEALKRLDVLDEVKRRHPALNIYAHGVIVRVAHDDDPLEEKNYYGHWGPELRRISEWTDRVERSGDPAQLGQLKEAQERVPVDVLVDWLATRERNHAVHRAAIDLLDTRVIERLHLTLDDTTPYGLAARDRRRLEAILDARHLWDRAEVYPGADEVSAVLLVRALLGERQVPVRVVYPSASSPEATTRYEDRPLGALVHDHLRACGAHEVKDGAAFTLFVNAPATAQTATQPDYETVDTPARHLPAFAQTLRRALAEGQPAVLADVAYPNGAERRLMTLLNGAPLHRLLGFAAWNTAGNTLGSAVATGICAQIGQDRRARIEALFTRLVDDWLYQAEVRARVGQVLDAVDPFDLGDQKGPAEAEIDARMQPLAFDLWDRSFAPHLPDLKLQWKGSHLAWPRLFTGVFPLVVQNRAVSATTQTPP